VTGDGPRPAADCVHRDRRDGDRVACGAPVPGPAPMWLIVVLTRRWAPAAASLMASSRRATNPAHRMGPCRACERGGFSPWSSCWSPSADPHLGGTGARALLAAGFKAPSRSSMLYRWASRRSSGSSAADEAAPCADSGSERLLDCMRRTFGSGALPHRRGLLRDGSCSGTPRSRCRAHPTPARPADADPEPRRPGADVRHRAAPPAVSPYGCPAAAAVLAVK